MIEIIFIAGFAGGVIRGLVGFIKHQYSYKNVKFELVYFISMMIVSGLVGFVSTFAVRGLGFSLIGEHSLSPALAVIIGYAGGDFLENIYKIILKKPSLYKFKNGS